MKLTDAPTFIEDLDAGVFAEKLGRALSEVAAGVIDNNKAGKVTVSIDVSRIGESYQVGLKHKLAFVKPTRRGKSSEEDTTETVMHVGKGGRMTLFPEEQVPAGQMHMYRGAKAEPMDDK